MRKPGHHVRIQSELFVAAFAGDRGWGQYHLKHKGGGRHSTKHPILEIIALVGGEWGTTPTTERDRSLVGGGEILGDDSAQRSTLS